MNFGTGLVLAVLVVIVGGIVFKLRQNKGSCGCGCSKCASYGICHKDK